MCYLLFHKFNEFQSKNSNVDGNLFNIAWATVIYIYLGFHQVWYQGGVKATVSGIVEDLKFKISEGSDPNWCFPDSAQLAVSV